MVSYRWDLIAGGARDSGVMKRATSHWSGQLCERQCWVVVKQWSVGRLGKEGIGAEVSIGGETVCPACLTDGSQGRDTGGGVESRMSWDLGAERYALRSSTVVVVTPGVCQRVPEVSGPLSGFESSRTSDGAVLQELAGRACSRGRVVWLTVEVGQ